MSERVCNSWSLVGLSLLVLASTCASAQELGSLDWFKSRWAQAEIRPIPENIYIEYIIESPVPGGEDELNRLRALVDDKPDHPLRRQYEDLQWQMTNAAKSTRYRLWYSNPNLWRLSQDYHHQIPIPFVDRAVHGREAWQLTSRDLSLVNPRNPPPDRNPAEALSALPFYLQGWFHPGMSPGTPLRLQPTDATLQGTNWSSTFQSADGNRRFLITGAVLNDEWIQIDSVTVTHSSDEPQWKGSTTRYSDWRYHELHRS